MSYYSFYYAVSLKHITPLPFLTFFFIFSASVVAEDSEKSPAVKIDWNQPVVSRGFTGDIASSVDEQRLVDQYKSGQVLYFFRDYQKAIEKWKPLLAENFSLAQASMGWLYQMGLGVDRDTQKAFSLYLAAAKQDNAVAQNNLGVMYEQGIEVQIDTKKARYWYEKSAKNGYRFGQYNYANVLLNGEGGAKDSSAAISWYKKAAELNVKQAIDKLALLIDQGE